MSPNLTGPTIIVALLIALAVPLELAAQQKHHYKLGTDTGIAQRSGSFPYRRGS